MATGESYTKPKTFFNAFLTQDTSTSITRGLGEVACPDITIFNIQIFRYPAIVK